MFKAVFDYEVRKRLNKRDIIIFFIILLTLVFMVQHGKKRYLASLENQGVFQEMESTKVSKYSLYRQYGAFGIKLLFVPSKYSIIYSDYAFMDLQSSLNIAEKLNIFKPVKGKGFFAERSGFMSFAGVLLLLIVLVSLAYGFDQSKNKEDLSLMSDLAGTKNLFWPIAAARLLLLTIGVLLLALIPLVTLFFDGINLFELPLLYFLLPLVLMSTLFYLVGGLVGTIKKSLRGFMLAAVYFVSIIFFPYLSGIGSEINASDIESLLKFESGSLKITLSLDKKLIDKYGSLKSTDITPREVIETTQEAVNEVWERENERIDIIKQKIKQGQAISNFLPILFYLSSGKELSSHGGSNLIDFYSFSKLRKKQFLGFYFEKRFFSKSSPDHVGPVENFIKGDENIFQAKSRLPHGYTTGLILNLFYILVLLFFLHRRSARQETKDKNHEHQVDFEDVYKDLDPEEKRNSSLVFCADPETREGIYTFYQKDQENAACIRKYDIEKDNNGMNFKTVLRYFSRLERLSPDDQAQAAMFLSLTGITDLNAVGLTGDDLLKVYAAVKIAQLPGPGVLVMNEFFKDMGRGFENSFLPLFSRLETIGFKVLYLSDNFSNQKRGLKETHAIKDYINLPLEFDLDSLR